MTRCFSIKYIPMVNFGHVGMTFLKSETMLVTARNYQEARVKAEKYKRENMQIDSIATV